MEAQNLTIFCNPASAYHGMREKEVARAYETMAVNEYDNLVKFFSAYEKWKEIPDFVDGFWKKENLHIRLQAFVGQEVERVGEVEGPLYSASYMFNPINPQKPKRLLPDLDVVSMDGAVTVRS